MAFCQINGITVSVSVESWTELYQRSDPGFDKAFDGTGYKTERFRKRLFKGKTTPLPYAEAVALQAVIDGDGDSFTADGSGTYTGKARYVYGTGSTSSGGKHGNKLTVASGDDVYINVDGSGDWTVLHWRDSWTHWAWTDDDDAYSDGLTSATDPDNWLDVTNTLLRLRGKNTSGSDASADYDEIYFIPARLTATQIGEWYAANDTNAFPELPQLRLDGSCVGNTATTVLGEVTEATPVFVDDGGTSTEYWEITFELIEV